jgi:PKD repeat protein
MLLSFCSILVIAQNKQDATLHLSYSQSVEHDDYLVNSRTYHLDEIVDNKVYRILQFDQIPGKYEKNQISKLGIELLDYIPENAYLAAIPIGSLNDLEKEDQASVYAFSPQIKLHQDAYLNLETASEKYVQHHFFLRFYKNLNTQKIQPLCEENDIRISRSFPERGLMEIIVHSEFDLERIIDLPFVQFVSPKPTKGEREDIGGSSLHRSNLLNSNRTNGLQYDGSGINMLVRDDGPMGPHIDFKNRLTNLPTATNTGTHGDMVGGIMGGAGNIDPEIVGMAPGAFLYVTDYEFDFLDTTLGLHLDAGVVITNSSYSNGCNDGYTESTFEVDQQIYNHPNLLHVFSAGNSRSRDCNYGAGPGWATITGGHKQAKNAIATANLRPNSRLETSSSWGPAHDGRIKPDLAANGTGHLSTNENNKYRVGGGTSAAAPGVAGVSAQLYHAYMDMYGELPPSALIKSCLMNTANDIGNPGPDFKFGWGIINAWRAYQLLADQRYLIDSIAHSNVKTYEFTIDENVHEYRFMLYWPDPPASVMSSKALINNLDLRIKKPDGSYKYPWVPDHNSNPTDLDRPARPNIDNLNNVEQIIFIDPEPGQYSIEIKGKQIPFDQVQFYILREVITEKFALTYPAGGESFDSRELIRIHWDAYAGAQAKLELQYQIEGGADWTRIDKIDAELEQYMWNIPDVAGSKIRIRMLEDDIEVSISAFFHVLDQPHIPAIIRTCKDSVWLSWSSVPAATQYTIYRLEEKYMDSVSTTLDTMHFLQNFEEIGENWFAVRAETEFGVRSKRSKAVSYNSANERCQLNYDLVLKEILTPGGDEVYFCTDTLRKFTFEIQNHGKHTADSITLMIQQDRTASIHSSRMEIKLESDSSMIITYDYPFEIVFGAQENFQLEIIADQDELPENNRKSISFASIPSFAAVAADSFHEDFTPQFPPEDWHEVNLDPDAPKWRDTLVIQRDGALGQAMISFDEAYDYYRQSMDIRTPIIDLDSINNPFLLMDVAFNSTISTFPDSLFIYAHIACDAQDKRLLATLSSNELEFLNNQTPGIPRLPADSSDWWTVPISLDVVKDQKIVLSFVNKLGYTNTLLIDNLRITEGNGNASFISIKSDLTEACAPGPFTFEARSVGNVMDLEWDFGIDGTPSTASGPGPHTVEFQATSGQFFVKLNGATGQGTLEAVTSVQTAEEADAYFTYDIDSLDVQFYSLYSPDYYDEWNFGDGDYAYEDNPSNTFPNGGTYTVRHIVYSDCSVDTISQQVSIEFYSDQPIILEDESSITIFPQPVHDELSMLYRGILNRNAQISVRGINGSLLHHQNHELTDGFMLKIKMNSYPPGLYILHIKMDGKVYNRKVLKL